MRGQLNDDAWIVHIYAVVRVPIRLLPEEAKDAKEALEKATDKFLDNRGLQNLLITGNRPLDPEDAEEIVGYMVDEPGDVNYDRSKLFDEQGNLTDNKEKHNG